MRLRRKRILLYLALAFTSFIFVLCYSSTTSPLFPGVYGADSALFQLIGKYWSIELFGMEAKKIGGMGESLISIFSIIKGL